MDNLRLRSGYCMLVFVGIILGTQATGKFVVQLIDFKNPDHKVYNGECCDNINWCSLNDCDNFFRFCAVMLGSTEQCSLGGLLSTGVVGDDSFTFGSDLGGGVKNPITYSFDEWKGVSVAVEVWDDDGGHLIGKLADLVDKYTFVVTDTPAKNKASSSSKERKLCGKRSCTNIKTQVYCDDNYLIPQCNEYCVARDNDLEGHYTCDYDRGLKVCVDGWYDESSNCTKKKKECTPRNDTAGHYDCNPKSGEQICHTGWMGINCTQVYVPSSLRPPSTRHQTQTAHAQQTTTMITTTDTPGQTMGTTTTKTQNVVKTSSSNVLITTTSETTQATKTHNSQSSKTTEKIHTTPTTTEATSANQESKVMSSSKPLQPSSTELKGSKTITHHSSATTNIVVKSSIVNKYETMATMLMPTSVLKTLSAHASTVSTTMIGPTTGWDHVVVINVSPSKNWTKEKENKIKDILTDQMNEFCKNQPQSCYINPNSTNSSTTVFNRTDVVIDTINGTTGGRVLVSVKVKIPGMSGGILVPSIVVKKVIKSSTELIEKQTGLKVALDTATTITMSTTTSKPLTTGPSVDIKSTPTGSIIPGLTDYWAVIVCAIAATLLLLTITLCFTYHANRSNKIHPLHSRALTKTKVTSFSHKDNQELIALTRVHHVPANKPVAKVQAKDTGLRSRTSSINKDNRYPTSPFTPDYIDF